MSGDTYKRHEAKAPCDIDVGVQRSPRDPVYDWSRPEIRIAANSRQACFAKLLRQFRYDALELAEILDVGCGNGNWLVQLLTWGALPGRIHGLDMMDDRVREAQAKLPAAADVRVANGSSMPYADGSMDIVTVNTVFSSILDASLREQLAEEITRILSPSGIVLIYDFAISSPSNPNTVGISSREIRRIFPSFEAHCQSLTLAPPISRRLAPWSAMAVTLLEAWMPILRSHRMHLLRRTA